MQYPHRIAFFSANQIWSDTGDIQKGNMKLWNKMGGIEFHFSANHPHDYPDIIGIRIPSGHLT